MNPENTKDISVIIPIYNVSQFLLPCLQSVSDAIHNLDIEVLLIDDGSTDDSGEIARQYAERTPSFVYYRKENGGLGSARNYGIDRAAGKYLMFLDSDDLIESDMYDNMFALAERTESDFVFCNVSRFNSRTSWASSLHLYLFSNMPNNGITHISDNYNLFFDTIACNKLILRSFFNEHSLRFPENHMLYEDIPVTLPMHHMAKRVAFLRKAEYLWRVREGVSRSITQNTTSFKNITDRLAVVRSVFDYYRTVGDTDLLKHLQLKVLKIDLMIFVNETIRLPKKAAEHYIRLLNEFIDGYIDEELFNELSVTHRQKYEYLRKRDLDGIIKTIRYTNYKHSGTRVYQKDGNYFFDLPSDVFTHGDVIADNDYLDLEPEDLVDNITVSDNIVLIDTHVFLSRIPVAEENDLFVEAFLVGDVTGQRLPLEIHRIHNNSITERFGGVYNANTEQRDQYNYDFAGVQISIDLNSIGNCIQQEDIFCIELHYRTGINEGYCTLRRTYSRYIKKYVNSVFRTDDCQFRIGFDTTFQFYLTVEKRSGTGPEELLDGEPLTGSAALPEFRIRETNAAQLDYEIRLEQIPQGKDTIRLCIFDQVAGVKKAISICTADTVDGTISGKGSIDFSSDVFMNCTAGVRPLLVEYGDYSGEVFCSEPADVDFLWGDLSFCIMTESSGRVILREFRNWGKGEQSGGDRMYVRAVKYKAFREEPVQENVVFFESMWGSKYSNNPKAFYEYMDQAHPEYTCVWSFTDPGTPIAGNGKKVRRGSEEYYHYLATAKYLMTDVNFENAFVKRDGQIIIQTMHGTPYKGIGLDSKDDFPTKESVWKYVRKNMYWDYLISQGVFVDKKAFGIYKFYRTLLKTGYPRTDSIIQGNNDAADRLKQQLGIPKDKKVILYAPTWRVWGSFNLQIDLNSFMASIGDEYVFAVRIHHLSSEGFESPADGKRIFDLTSYSSIEDLYQIADILITDYSSVMFDFILTGKPIIFYTYDLEEYKDNLRGVYFDLETEAPGPLVYTEKELVDTIRNIASYDKSYGEKVNRFRQKFLTYENPNSSEKIFDEVFVKKYKTRKTRFLDGLENGINNHLPDAVSSFLEKVKIHLICLDETSSR